MTFKDVVFKNILGNIKQYLSYFLCSTYTITIFFMYAVIMYNEHLKDESGEVLKPVLPVAITALGIFSVFFITYAHTTFVKGRNKEFGIYISLGMDQKELKRMVNLENLFISAVSLISGLTVGALFSRVFQMAVMSLLQLDDIEYEMNPKAFVLTIAVFALIFALVFLLTSLKMNRTDITTLLRDARSTEMKTKQKQNGVLGILGILLITASAGIIAVITRNSKLYTSPIMMLLFVLPAFIGIYMFLSYGINYIIQCLKPSRFYASHMLEITEIMYKSRSNKRIIFILSVLSAMTISFVASPFSLVRTVEQIVDDGSHNLEFASVQGYQEVTGDEADQILQTSGAEITYREDVPFLFLYQTKENQSIDQTRIVVPVSQYNSMTGSRLTVPEGYAVNVHNNWVPGTFGVEEGETYSLYSGEKSYSFTIQSSGRGLWIAELNTFPAASEFVINDEMYERIYQEVTQNGKITSSIGVYHFYDFDDWKKEKNAVEELKEKLSDPMFPVNAMILQYQDLKNGYSVFLFICSVLGILFFTAGGGVLYFKQFSELDSARQTFRRLFKIGITGKEMHRIIGNQLLFVFYTPLVFGTFVGVGLMYLMTYLVGGSYVIDVFMKNAWLLTGVYFAAQSVFYLITRRKYVSEIMKERFL